MNTNTEKKTPGQIAELAFESTRPPGGMFWREVSVGERARLINFTNAVREACREEIKAELIASGEVVHVSDFKLAERQCDILMTDRQQLRSQVKQWNDAEAVAATALEKAQWEAKELRAQLTRHLELYNEAAEMVKRQAERIRELEGKDHTVDANEKVESKLPPIPDGYKLATPEDLTPVVPRGSMFVIEEWLPNDDWSEVSEFNHKEARAGHIYIIPIPSPTFTHNGKTWNRHSGGECPVDSDIEVEILFRGKDFGDQMLAGVLRWNHKGNKGDIIGWRHIDSPERDERAEFEAWAKPRYGESQLEMRDSVYANACVYYAFDAWQARAQLEGKE